MQSGNISIPTRTLKNTLADAWGTGSRLGGRLGDGVPPRAGDALGDGVPPRAGDALGDTPFRIGNTTA